MNASSKNMIKNGFPPIPIIIIIIIIFLSLPFNGNSQTISPNQEKTILLELKQHWSNPPSLGHWTPSSDHCAWPEITCANGSVTGIAVVDRNITDTIPPSMCSLANLALVDLNMNYIPGGFPTVLYNCSKLEYLDLSNNYFVGALPGDIDRLSPRLRALNLSANNFTGDIPAAIGKLSSLRGLQLTGNLFNGSIAPEIGDLSNLEELALKTNGFSMQPIPASFGKLKKLRYLWMRQANLIGEIPDSIGNMSALEFLDLAQNQLSGSIPGGIFLLENLTILHAFENRLSGPLPRRVEATKLQVIDVSQNTLNGTIPDDFGKLTSLTGLALNINQLSGEVPASIARLPLVNIKLFSNNLSGVLPPEFGRYSKLETFEVSANKFEGEVPKDLCANKVLIGVVVFDNKLTGGFPDSLGDCSSLKVVRVYGNELSGRIPDGLWTSENLTTLMISNNLFTGELPNKLGSKLTLLELMNNNFSGAIPASVSTWKNLNVLRASNNLLSGTIPQELTALASLSVLLLDGNQLSGNLPSAIVSWQSLSTLNLSRNLLSGEIPATIGRLPDLASLDLSENEFSGNIPPEFGLSSGLNELNLSSNRLSGRIPGHFENAAFSRSFLNNSGLCSDIRSVGLSACRVEARKSHKLPSGLIAAVSSIAAVAFLAVFLYTMYICRSYAKGKQVSDSTWKLTSFQRLNFTEATILSSLRDENQIGSGGSGKVFRVPINRSGDYVAVKRIWDDVKLDAKLEKEFLAEIRILGTIRHSNIVKLLCCISSETSKLLVYEYMENRSLDRWLHSRNRSYNVSGSVHHVILDWPKRLQIAIGAAHGLTYLHHHCSPPVIHRDVKSSNILLDSKFNAKIADFGLARKLVKSGEPNTMSVVAGSFGYMAPEYAQTRRVSEKIDVYSFGVILLELITGKEAHYGDESSSLAEWAWRHIQEGKPTLDIMDEDITDNLYFEDINTILKLGLICTSTYPTSRPAMKDVLQILLRCGQSLPIGEKTDGNEYDVAPLLEAREVI